MSAPGPDLIDPGFLRCMHIDHFGPDFALFPWKHKICMEMHFSLDIVAALAYIRLDK
jgi:hypothetical protein